MLVLTIPASECWNESLNMFIKTSEKTLRLEHSLISVSKWESKWHKAFLDDSYQKTYEENIDYIRCMTIDGNVDPVIYYCIDDINMKRIDEYLSDKMTATVVKSPKKNGRRGRKITSEVLYSQMITLGIPFECEKWNLNRLLTLMEVCNADNTPSKKMSNKDIFKQNAELNAMRKAKKHTKG